MLGHLAPMLPIGRGLTERGCDVTFITGMALRTRVEATGGKFHPLPGPADFDGPKTSPHLSRGAPGVEQGVRDMDIFISPIPGQHMAVQEVLAEGHAGSTVVLHDVFFHGLWPELLGAPGLRPAGAIGLGVTVLGLSSEETAPFGLGLAPDSSPEGIARNRILNDQVQRRFAPVQGKLDACLAGLGATRAAPYYWDAQSLLPDVTLQLYTAGFEYPRSAMPAHLEFVGRLLDVQDEVELPAWWPDLLAAERVVFVSQGSLRNDDFGALIGPALESLADCDALVVVTLGGRPVSDSLELPANARVASYLPYHAVLPHTDVFVSNGGFGGVQTALFFGVPLVLAGETEDKHEVAAHVEWSGTGVSLGTGQPTPRAVRTAVDKVLNDRSFRDNAKRIKMEYAQCDTMGRITDTIEGFIQNPRSR
jgi:UDP:flavonoid glycosyltransferase YjiC (YdhE family)